MRDPASGGVVSISLGRSNGQYEIRVSDTGAGIPPEAQPHIFQRFYRADQSRSRASEDGGGAGLGLAIARWIAEAHQGQLELEHSDKSGSVFVASLPAS